MYTTKGGMATIGALGFRRSAVSNQLSSISEAAAGWRGKAGKDEERLGERESFDRKGREGFAKVAKKSSDGKKALTAKDAKHSQRSQRKALIVGHQPSAISNQLSAVSAVAIGKSAQSTEKGSEESKALTAKDAKHSRVSQSSGPRKF